jgi:PRTRC genetic system protein E
MFKELVPVLRDRAVLLTVTLVDADQIRVNIVPKKLKDGDNDALTTPLSVTGTAEDLDAELSTTIISFVGSHLQMKNTLEKAKAEMDAASKAAQTEARAKAKTPAKTAPPNTEVTQSVPTANERNGLIWSDRVNPAILWFCFCRCFCFSRTERAAAWAGLSDD